MTNETLADDSTNTQAALCCHVLPASRLLAGELCLGLVNMPMHCLHLVYCYWSMTFYMSGDNVPQADTPQAASQTSIASVTVLFLIHQHHVVPTCALRLSPQITSLRRVRWPRSKKLGLSR